MEEIWKVFRDLKDDKHPYASTWEVSNFGNIKRDGKLVELKINDWQTKNCWRIYLEV